MRLRSAGSSSKFKTLFQIRNSGSQPAAGEFMPSPRRVAPDRASHYARRRLSWPACRASWGSASIAHEVKQPLAAIVRNGQWVPAMARPRRARRRRGRAAVERIIRDSNPARRGASPRPRSARVESGPGTREEGDTTCLICPSAHDVTSGFFLRRLAPELADVISQAVFHITRSVKSPLH